MKTKVIPAALLIVVFSLPVAAEARPVRCFGKRATIVGTKGPDVLRGTRGRDVIAGRGGDDVIVGRGRRDLICGGGGDDRLSGGHGRDKLGGGPGSDFFRGDRGNDVLNGGRNADEDREWHDVLSYASSPEGVHVDTREGTAEGEGSDELVGYFEIVEGSEFDDRLDANTAFLIRGLGGNDHLGPGTLHTTLEGGPGDDVLEGDSLPEDYGTSTTVSYEQAPAGVQVDLAAGTATGEGNDTLIEIDDVTGSPHDDVLLGTDLGNILSGREGNDQLDGRGGEDWLNGGAGNDVVHGGPGDDDLGDHVQGSPDGDDQLFGDDGDDSFLLGLGADAIDGGAGIDAISYRSRDGLVIDLLTGVISFPGDPDDSVTSVENAYNPGTAGSASVTLIGDDGPNELAGGQGNDTIQGSGGDDDLRGGSGDDDIDGGEGVDVAYGKDGVDRCVNVERAYTCER